MGCLGWKKRGVIEAEGEMFAYFTGQIRDDLRLNAEDPVDFFDDGPEIMGDQENGFFPF